MNILENGNISIAYMRSNGVLDFSDAIILTPEEFEQLTPADITAIQDQRFASWLEHVTVMSNQLIEEQI